MFDSTWTLSEVDKLNLRSIELNKTYHTLIPSRFPTVDVFARIANDRSVEVAEVETITNPRLKERRRLLSGASVVDVDDPRIQNWNHAPFTYFNPTGTRFFGPERPALEMAEDMQTALIISVGKREAFLSRTCEDQIGIEMRVLSRMVKGRFVDATDWDPNLDQLERRSRGDRIAEAGFDGLVFRPSERPCGKCVSVLRGGSLDRAMQGDHFKFVWNGTRVETLYSFSSGRAFTPDDLRSENDVLAA